VLKNKINEYSSSGQSVFPQGDTNKKKNLIFQQIVSEEKLHQHFKTLANVKGYSPAKEIIKEITYAFIDLDGNFIQQFQSDGFNARIWELFIYAFLHEDNFDLRNDIFPAPDFNCTKLGLDLSIEAVTVNPTENESVQEISLKPDEIQEKIKDYMPIKFGSPLFSKLKKRYWEKEHVKGHPLIFAIQDFHQETSMLWSRTALTDYLYGVRHKWEKDSSGNLTIISEKIEKHSYNGKEIPSGFFFLPDSENVSAVLFSNSATIAKFNRMGWLAGFGNPTKVNMIRVGTCHDHDPNATEPLKFKIDITDERYQEDWGQGLSLYHNPMAKYPIPPEIFPSIGHHFFEEGKIVSYLPDFYPYASFTYISIN
ncbi:MAG: hypothetical protein PF904_08630, partial [Kiritimatiellae bacterium]|nr:hypothetical protein [Kiritimatiellia bacterium]